MNFWEYMYKGLCHGGYVIGLVVALIVVVALIALVCIILGDVFGEQSENDETEQEFERRGNHVRKNQQL